MNHGDTSTQQSISDHPLTQEEVIAAQAKITANKDKKEKTPIFPVPGTALPCSFALPKIGKPTALYPYHNAADQLLGYIARFDTVNPETGERQKIILPVCFCELSNGKRGWRSVGMPKPRPLYNLSEIMARADVAILVGEGEKVAEAGKLLFPNYVSTTPMHGAQSPQHTDWSPVKGRTVIITTDYDEAGAGFGDAVHNLCMAAGAARVLHLPAEELGKFQWIEGKPSRREEPVAQGYDIADLLTEGWTTREAAMVMSLVNLPLPYISQDQLQALQKGLGGAFRLTPRGVEYAKEVKDKDGNPSIEWHWFCSYLAVTHQTRDTQGHNWGVILELIDNDGARKDYVMPMALLAGDGVAYREELLGRGLKLAPKAKDVLHSYITVANPKARAICVLKPGWHNRCFVAAGQVYGAVGGERIVLQHEPQQPLVIRGTLQEWQNKVGSLCAGNSRLVLVTAIALCPPLLYLLGEENFGVHLSGGSSAGKSTGLEVAASTWGFPLRSWRATDNATESLARQANDMALFMDELSQADASSADALAYMLGNGVSKARARRDGAAKTIETFRLVFLSSGETGLAAKILEGGKQAKAGQSVRFIEVPADAGKGFGIFDTLHDFADGNLFAIELKRRARLFTGTVSDAFLKALCADTDNLITRIVAARKYWVEQNVPPASDGQVLRVGQKFGLIAAVGELAIALGILPWPPEEVSAACVCAFSAWLGQRGGTQAQELTQAEKRLRLLIAQHGSSRFEAAWGEDEDNRIGNGSPHDRRVVQRAGFKRLNASKEWEYFILPEIFEQEIIGSLPEAKVKPYLAERGLIMRDSQNKYTVSIRVPGFKQARLYHVPASVLSGNEPDGVADGAGVAIKNTATPTSMPAAQPCVSMQFKQKEGVSSSATPQTHETPAMQLLPEEWQERVEERAAISEFDGGIKGA